MGEERNTNSDYEKQQLGQSYHYGYQKKDQQYEYQNGGYHGSNDNIPQYYKRADSFAVASLIMGILSLLFVWCLGIGGIVAGALGMIFAILSRKGKPMEGQAKIGMGMSIIGLTLGVLILSTFTAFLVVGMGQEGLQNRLENELERYGYEFRFGDDYDDDYDYDYDDRYQYEFDSINEL